MEKRFEDLPNWTFWIGEISAGVYNLKGKEDVFGANLNLTGTDPEELLRQARDTVWFAKTPAGCGINNIAAAIPTTVLL